MSDLIATATNLATAESGTRVALQSETILGPPYNTANWSTWVEPVKLPPGFSHVLKLDPSSGNIVVQLKGRPPAGHLIFKAGFKYVFKHEGNGSTEIFQALLDTGPITIRPAGSTVKTYGELIVALNEPNSGPARDSSPLRAKRPALLSAVVILVPGFTYTLTFGVVIDMTVSGSEVYTEVIAPARYAERRPLRFF